MIGGGCSRSRTSLRDKIPCSGAINRDFSPDLTRSARLHRCFPGKFNRLHRNSFYDPNPGRHNHQRDWLRRTDMGRKPQRPTRKKKQRPVKAENAPQADMRKTVDIILQDCDPKSLTGLAWLAKDGRHISGEDLAVAIEANPSQPLPDVLRDYLCRFLRGKVKRKPGPNRSEPEFDFLIEFVAA